MAKAMGMAEMPPKTLIDPRNALVAAMGKAHGEYIACYIDKVHDLGGFGADEPDSSYDAYLQAAYDRCSRQRQKADQLISNFFRTRYPSKSANEVAALTAMFRGAPILKVIQKKFEQTGYGTRFNKYIDGLAVPKDGNAPN